MVPVPSWTISWGISPTVTVVVIPGILKSIVVSSESVTSTVVPDRTIVVVSPSIVTSWLINIDEGDHVVVNPFLIQVNTATGRLIAVAGPSINVSKVVPSRIAAPCCSFSSPKFSRRYAPCTADDINTSVHMNCSVNLVSFILWL